MARFSRTAILSLLVVLLAAAGPARAQTFEEALVQVWQTSPVLDAARTRLKAVDEQAPQALSGYRPLIDATGDIGKSHVDREEGGSDTLTPASVALTVTQPLYRGGRTVSSVSRAENQIMAQRASLLSTEQDVLLSGVTAWMDVVRDQAVVSLNVSNEQVLRRQYGADRDRFEVGVATRTDVSQAQSRLARATSDRIAVEGILEASRATFMRVFGLSPGELKKPEVRLPLPSSLDEAITLAQDRNPAVVSAVYTERASHNTVDTVRGELLPEASLQGRLGRDWDSGSGSTSDQVDSATILAQVRIPLYEAGSVTSRVREAKHTANQRRIEIEDLRRTARENAIRAWTALTTAQAELKSRQAQIRAASTALEGTREESKVGTRTTLDVLDAEQEVLNARVALVQAQRNEVVASYQLLAAVGGLTAQNLGLPVTPYDPEAHYREVRDAWWGTGVEEYDDRKDP
ncbi:MAG: TolC family outer membrane protein [Pseudomonadota bacterium]|nr:TolC family outer membrane protein [Pseudomonadota bacterium]